MTKIYINRHSSDGVETIGEAKNQIAANRQVRKLNDENLTDRYYTSEKPAKKRNYSLEEGS